jgi:hypothetical protein
VDKATEMPLPIIEDKNNHLMDSLRYGSEGKMRLAKAKRREDQQVKLEMFPVNMSWK